MIARFILARQFSKKGAHGLLRGQTLDPAVTVNLHTGCIVHLRQVRLRPSTQQRGRSAGKIAPPRRAAMPPALALNLCRAALPFVTISASHAHKSTRSAEQLTTVSAPRQLTFRRLRQQRHDRLRSCLLVRVGCRSERHMRGCRVGRQDGAIRNISAFNRDVSATPMAAERLACISGQAAVHNVVTGHW